MAKRIQVLDGINPGHKNRAAPLRGYLVVVEHLKDGRRRYLRQLAREHKRESRRDYARDARFFADRGYLIGIPRFSPDYYSLVDKLRLQHFRKRA